MEDNATGGNHDGGQVGGKPENQDGGNQEHLQNQDQGGDGKQHEAHVPYERFKKFYDGYNDLKGRFSELEQKVQAKENSVEKPDFDYDNLTQADIEKAIEYGSKSREISFQNEMTQKERETKAVQDEIESYTENLKAQGKQFNEDKFYDMVADMGGNLDKAWKYYEQYEMPRYQAEQQKQTARLKQSESYSGNRGNQNTKLTYNPKETFGDLADYSFDQIN